MSHPLPKHILMEHLDQARQETKCLAEISNALNHAFDLPKLLNDICNRVCHLLGYKACSIMLARENATVLTVEGYAGMEREYIAQLNTKRLIRLNDADLSSGPSGRAFLMGSPVAVTNIHRERQFHPWLSANPGFSAMVALPLEFRGNRIGVLNCYTAHPHEFSDRERHLLRTIASQAAAGIGIVQLLGWKDEQLQQQQALVSAMEAQRDQLIQARQVHDRLTTIILTGGDVRTLARAAAGLVENPIGVVSNEGNLLTAYGPDGQALSTEWAGHRLEWAWQWASQTETPVDLRPVQVPASPEAGCPLPRVITPIMAGEEYLGSLVVVECVRPLNPVDVAALEHAGTAMALDLIRAQALFETEQRLRGDFIFELLRGQFTSEEYIRKRFEQLGFRPTGPCQIILVQVDGMEEAKSGAQAELIRRRLLTQLEQLVAVRQKNSLVVHWNGLFTIIWPDQSSSDERTGCSGIAMGKAIQEAVQSFYADRQVRIGIGRAYKELARLKDSFHEASSALRIMHQLGSANQVLSFTELGLYRVLLESTAPQQLLDFAKDTLEPIRKNDLQWNTGLEQTLRAYFQCQMNTQRTAEALYVHPNTVMYRLKKLEQIVGAELKDAQVLLRLQLALLISDIGG